MSDIRIHRPHHLGLARARRLAATWTADAERQFDMVCTRVEGDGLDTVAFTRSGVKGELVVAADHFELVARLGLLLSAFAPRIQREIELNLDGLLASAAAEPAPGA